MTNVIWFKDISKEDVNLVGGKGANLGEMFNAKFPIPSGFVVSAEAYKIFLEKTGIQSYIGEILRNTDIEINDQLQSASKKIQDLILRTDMPVEVASDIKKAYENMNVNVDLANVPKQTLDFIQVGRDNPFVAVRSSATAEDLPDFSFAGQQATYLNVKKTDNVIQAVHQCWASLYTARAIYYREKNNFDHNKVFIAVVVQKMVDSEKAGVMFSINPATNNEDEIIIEAGFGFGDAVVSGAISPDNYVVDKHTFEIKNKTINNKEFMFYRDPNTGRTNKRILSHDKSRMQVLNENEIIQIAKLAKLSEEYYKNPQDMEFAIAGNKVYMVQTRAITTQDKVSKAVSEKVEEIDGEEILSGISASPGVGKGIVKIVNNADELSKITKGDVLVAKMTNPDYVSAMQKASAIVTNEGGSTCHAAIVSREMGIPSVVGTSKATEVLKEGQEITVDGTHGKIYSGDKSIEADKDEVSSEVMIKYQHEHTVTEIKVIVDMPDLAEKAAKTGADGIGLLRAEFMILGEKEHPIKLINEGRKEELVDRLESDLTKIVTPFRDKVVWYRTLDAPTDEFRHMSGGEDEPKEDNPMMGWRSIRRDLDQPEMLKAQLEAIKRVRAKGFDKLGLMIPLVSHVEQIRLVKAILRELDMEEIEFGVMIETPASVQLIEEFCQEGIKFASIGSNDLTQFTLAVDRNNAKIQKLYNPMHPAVLKEISQVIKVCKRHGVISSLCGQAGSDPEMAKFLVEKGIDSIAVNIDAVGKVRHAVAEREKKLMLDAARR
jgi:pyruvate, water dikinase